MQRARDSLSPKWQTLVGSNTLGEAQHTFMIQIDSLKQLRDYELFTFSVRRQERPRQAREILGRDNEEEPAINHSQRVELRNSNEKKEVYVRQKRFR